MKVYEQIHEQIKRQKPTEPLEVILIGICGEYAAGKTTFSDKFARYLAEHNINPFVLESDMYFKMSKPERQGFFKQLKNEGLYETEFHRGYELEESLMKQHLTDIRQRKDIHKKGLYQRTTGEKDKEFAISFDGRPTWVIYDGVWVANPAIRNEMDFSVKLIADESKRMERARKRAQESGKSYSQSPERFMKIDSFVNDYIAGFNPQFNLTIDNSDFNDPKILY